MRAVLEALLVQTPDQLGYFAVNWTVPCSRDALAVYTGRRPSADTIRRELDRLGYVWKRLRDALDPDPSAKKTPDPQESPGLAACAASCWLRMRRTCCCFRRCDRAGPCEGSPRRCICAVGMPGEWSSGP